MSVPVNQILVGHAAQELARMPSEWASCCVTSPPYWGLRDYGLPPVVFGGLRDCEHVWQEIRKPAANGQRDAMVGVTKNFHSATRRVTTSTSCGNCGAWRGQLGLEPTPALYVEHLVEIMREVRRALRPDGTLWLNLGDCYATGAGSARTPGGDLFGKSNRVVNAGSYPVSQPNRMPIEGLKSKDLVGVPWRVAFALQADGWFLRSDIVWQKPNALPESVKDRPTRSHEYIFLLSKSEHYYYDHRAVMEPQSENERTRRLRERGKGLVTKYRLQRDKYRIGQIEPGKTSCLRSVEARYKLAALGLRNRRTVWSVTTKRFGGAHFATFPEGIPDPCIQAGSAAGGIVLDPFAGAGTVAAVALKRGRQFVGIELNQEYAEMARKRLEPLLPPRAKAE